MPTLKLRIHGLRHADDAARVRQALLDEPGVFGAVVAHDERCAEIDYEDDEVGIPRLLDLVAACGFEARTAG